MADIEKVIKGIEQCLICGIAEDKCIECPYRSDASCITRIKRDALELLKGQQERIKVLEEEAKTKDTPQKVLNRKELADLIVGTCPLCGALFNNEICPTACGWCGCLLDWKDGEQE